MNIDLSSASSPFANDPVFQQGLHSILAPLHARGASPEEIAEVTQRAESFYAQSKTASSSSSSHPAPAATQPPTPSPPPPATADSTPYPLSFAALANLIATGAPIPGIKDIPDKLAEGAPSVSTAQVQKKPWEGVVGAAEERAGGGGPVHNAKVKEEGSGQV